MNGGLNMPKLDGQKYSYDEKGMKKYLSALKKKRKKKKTEIDYESTPEQHLAGGE